MSIQINVGLSKKVGLPNYGSLGASCSVDLEAGHGLLEGDLAEFKRRVSGAFAACRQVVEEELVRQQGSQSGNATDGPRPRALPPQYGGYGNGSGHRNGSRHSNGDGQDHAAPSSPTGQNGQSCQTGHAASEKQFSYAKQLAKQIQGLGLHRLETLAEKMYGKPLVAMSSFDASGLIDTLKAIKAGEINLDTVLNGDAA